MGKSKQIKSSDAGHNTAMKRDRNLSSQVESMKVKSVNGISKSQEQDKSVGKSSKKQKKAMPSPSESSTESESDDQSQIGSETSDSETDESDQSDDESIDESSADNAKTVSKPRSLLDTKGKVSKVVTNGTKSHMIREAVETNETDGTTSDATSSDSSDDDTDSGKVGANAGVAPYTNGVTQNDRKPRATQSPSDDEAVEANAGSDSSSDEDDDNSSTGSSEDEGAPANATLKRKADAVQEPVAKKLKTVEATKPKNLFVGNLSWNVDEEWLRREFESFGEVVGCRIVTDRDSGRSKGFGYVDFATSEEAEKALVAKKGSELDGRPMNVDFSEPRKDASVGNNRERANDRSRNFGDVLSPPSDTLFIANLSFETTAENLKENFEEFGSITRISLPTHPDSGQLKGFGYIGFSCIDEAQAALDAWKGESLLGRPIRVDFSTPRPDGGFGASRGGRGGSFRGRGGADHGGRRGAFRGAGSRGRGAPRGGRGGSTNRGGVGDFSGKKMTF